MSFENHIYYEDDNIRQQRAGYAGQPVVQLGFQDECVMGYGDPFVVVFVNGIQHDKVWAYISKEQGADGGWYPVVKFRRSGEAKSTHHEAGTGGG